MPKYLSLLAVPALAGLLLCGCYENLDPPAPQAESQPAQTPPPAAATGGPRTSGAPALSGARRAAENITSDATERSQEIADGDY